MGTSDESRMAQGYTVFRFHRWPFPVNRFDYSDLYSFLFYCTAWNYV